MIELILFFIAHFLADFVFQSREMGEKKSKDLKVLFEHGCILSTVFFITTWIVMDFVTYVAPSATSTKTVIGMVLIVPFIHCLQDWYIWRGYKYFVRWRIAKKDFKGDINNTWMEESFNIYEYWKDKWFYATIGLDQTLHFITIVAVYSWLK